jgi:hypothetical protein
MGSARSPGREAIWASRSAEEVTSREMGVALGSSAAKALELASVRQAGTFVKIVRTSRMMKIRTNGKLVGRIKCGAVS